MLLSRFAFDVLATSRSSDTTSIPSDVLISMSFVASDGGNNFPSSSLSLEKVGFVVVVSVVDVVIGDEDVDASGDSVNMCFSSNVNENGCNL